MSFMERKRKVCSLLNCMPIPDFEDYLLSREGKLYYLDPEIEECTDITNIALLRYNKTNVPIYNIINLKVTTKFLEIALDKLVLKTYIGELDTFILHKDDDPKNCSLDNLKYECIIKYLDDYSITICNKIFKLTINKNYYVSAEGILFSIQKQKFMHKNIDMKFYYMSPKSCGSNLHRLVYSTWIGEIPEGLTINHKDGKKWNNHYSNLEVATNAENFRHAQLNGLRPNSRWNEEDIHIMCKMMEENKSSVEVAKYFGFSSKKDRQMISRTLSEIRSQIMWKDISSQYKIENYQTNVHGAHGKLSEKDIIEICDLIVQKVPKNKIAKRFDITTDHVNSIKRGKYYSELTHGYNLQDVDYGAEKIESICKLLKEGKSKEYIVQNLHVGNDLVNSILNKERFTEISNKYDLEIYERHKSVKLSKEDVIKICELLMSKTKKKNIAKQYGVSEETIAAIYNKKTWSELTIDYTFPQYNSPTVPVKDRLTVVQVHEICKLFMIKYPKKLISEKYNISIDYINRMQRREYFNDITSQYDFIPYSAKEEDKNCELLSSDQIKVC